MLGAHHILENHSGNPGRIPPYSLALVILLQPIRVIAAQKSLPPPHVGQIPLERSLESGGQIVTRIVTTQFAFVPRCVVVPVNRPVTLRLASPDVLHGILVSGTNVNTMVVPGYVSQVHTVFTRTGDLLMPCHEFCGLGHSQMLATVRVVSRYSPSSAPHVPVLTAKA